MELEPGTSDRTIEPLPVADAQTSAGPAAGQWKAVISLGSSCAIAYHLHRKGLAGRTGPLDWYGSRNSESLARLLRTRFASYMDRDAISVRGEHNGYWKVSDDVNSVFTLHDFPIAGRKPKPLWRPSTAERFRRVGDRLVEPAWRWLPSLFFPGPDGSKIPLPAFPEFRRRIARRVSRFVATLEDPGPVLLIRRAREEHEARTLLNALLDVRGRLPTTLLVLGPEEPFARDWGVRGLRTAAMPPEDPTVPDDWRGRAGDWDRLFEGCQVE